MGWWQRRKLVSALKSADVAERRQAVAELAELGDPEAAPELRALLDDPDGAIQTAAVGALARMGDAGAVPGLTVLLQRPGTAEALRLAVVEALGRLPGPAASDALAAALEATLAIEGDLSPEQGRRVHALGAALAARNDLRAAQGLLVALTEADSALAARLVADLQRLGWTPGDDVERALWAIVRLEPEELARVAEDGLSLLLHRLDHPDPRVRAQAADLLGRIQERRGYDRLVELAQDPEPQVQDAATLSLVRLGWRPVDAGGKALAAIARAAWREVADCGAAAVAPLQSRISRTRLDGLSPFELEETLRRLNQIALALAEALRREPEAVEVEVLRAVLSLPNLPPGAEGSSGLDCSRARTLAQTELVRRRLA